jgi:1-acyl-sn-glycerol-3-phosphate acyltransferase
MDIDVERRSLGARAAALPQALAAAVAPAQPDLEHLRARTLRRGINRPLYLLARAVLTVAFRLCLRLEDIGGEDLPRRGPLLLASNHRSFLDPFVIGVLMKRPVYYVAKRELFQRRWQAWLLASLGAFPIDRGAGDREAMATAKAILDRGDCVLIFPEGTRVRPGPLGSPRRGVGRLALETGAVVVPVAVIGTDEVRDGWRLRPRKVRVRFGRSARYPRTDEVSPSLAAGVTGRVWACVALQWEWLGGDVPPRPQRLAAAERRVPAQTADAAAEAAADRAQESQARRG